MIPNIKKHYTYSDYLKWDTEDRYELIHGTPYLLSAPSTEHQRISNNLAYEFTKYFRDTNNPCEVFSAPFDVRLFKNIGYYDESKIDCVVQPDISIICNKDKLDSKGCKGSPDLIIEILSNSTASKDYIQKLDLYQFNGVKEYWIVSPKNKNIQVFKLENELYGEPSVYSINDVITTDLFEELSIELKNIFR